MVKIKWWLPNTMKFILNIQFTDCETIYDQIKVLIMAELAAFQHYLSITNETPDMLLHVSTQEIYSAMTGLCISPKSLQAWQWHSLIFVNVSSHPLTLGAPMHFNAGSSKVLSTVNYFEAHCIFKSIWQVSVSWDETCYGCLEILADMLCSFSVATSLWQIAKNFALQKTMQY